MLVLMLDINLCVFIVFYLDICGVSLFVCRYFLVCICCFSVCADSVLFCVSCVSMCADSFFILC